MEGHESTGQQAVGSNLQHASLSSDTATAIAAAQAQEDQPQFLPEGIKCGEGSTWTQLPHWTKNRHVKMELGIKTSIEEIK